MVVIIVIDEEKFKNIGFNVAQIGFYLMSIDSSLFTNTELHRNVVSLLSQVSIYLSDVLNNKIDANSQKITTKQYLSKSELVKMYHPLVTEYGLRQAINKHSINFIKQGSKYFFERTDIEEWINKKKSGIKDNLNVKNIKFV